MTDIDPVELGLAQLAVFKVKEGELLGLMLALGNRLGLFTAMVDQQWHTPSDLAAVTATHERWVREWLYSVAAADLVDHDGGRFRLSPAMAAVLGDRHNAAFAGAIFVGPPQSDVIDRLVDSFRTGIGFGWDDHGAGAAETQLAMSGNGQRAFLVSHVLAAIPGLIERLEAGIRVIDVGCGAGVAAHTIADAFPRSSVLGIDPSAHALDLAFALRDQSGLSNLSFSRGTFDDLTAGSADLVTTFDVLHDLPFPDRAAAAVRRSLGPDGEWLVADIRCGPDFESNQRNPVRALMYSMSVAFCMNSALSEPGGAGLGTLGLHEAKIREIAADAGFGTVHVHDFDFDLSNRYYHLRLSV